MQKTFRFSLPFSAQLLILANVVTIVLAVWQQWDMVTVMWVYWCQSVIIGLFQFKKITDLKRFSTKDFRINGKSVEPTEATKKYTAYFFLFHYNGFHFLYFIFLAQFFGIAIAWSAIAAGAGIFFLNHLFSYRMNRLQDQERVPNIGVMMFFPYARIIPMHVTIIFGFLLTQNTYGLVIFLGLKTVADVIMHTVEHTQQS